MAASALDIANYLTYIMYAQSVYMDDINKREKLGHTELFKYRLRNTILNDYVKIMIDYFSQSTYNSNNFFTTDEVQDIIDRINVLCDTNYVLVDL